MTSLPDKGKWVDGLYADTPAVVAAKRVLGTRLSAVRKLLPIAAKHAADDIEYVHQLRVATRRSAAALRLFRDVCNDRTMRKLARLLKRVRRAAGVARQDDVHAALFAKRAAKSPQTEIDAPRPEDVVLEAIAESRADAQEHILDVAARQKQLRKRIDGLLNHLHPPVGSPESGAAYTLGQIAQQTLPALVERVRQHGDEDLREREKAHALRIEVKRLRYALEILVGCFPETEGKQLYEHVTEVQDRLGEINDLHEIAARLETLCEARRDDDDHDLTADDAELSDQAAGALAVESAAPLASPETSVDPLLTDLEELRDEYRAARDKKHRAFLEWWAALDTRAFLDQIETLCASLTVAVDDGESEAVASSTAAGENGRPRDTQPLRVAAVDVGTNSIRLVVAESDPLSKFRIIEDCRETARLGGGLYDTGRLSDASIERSLLALERMRDIAASHRVRRMRAVGTSALREAVNADDFLNAAKKRAGIEIEIIDAEQEARLAFSSVSNAFDLDGRRVATVDLGGGSTEVVFSSNGLIDEIVKLPIGAVRLTDMYGDGTDEALYHELRRAVDKYVRDLIGEAPFEPELMIGTGGTFTTLAKIAIRKGTMSSGAARFPFALRGYELPRAQVGVILNELRSVPLEQRVRTPGLSSRRAEIIVAGVCIIERLMDYLQIEKVRVHDGGIRDGLLAEMIDELGFRTDHCPETARAALAAVRRFAERCRYEKPHSEHVKRLSLRIFDQLAAHSRDSGATWTSPQARHLLKAAAILHDIGMLIGWDRHHKHSYEMVLNANIAHHSRREIELIANIARYHRRSGPKPSHANFARLSEDDQRLVRHLAGILRIADGLDRLHLQDVHDVVVYPRRKSVRFEVHAEQQPNTHIHYARRKSNLFEEAFRTTASFSWSGAAAAARRAIRAREVEHV